MKTQKALWNPSIREWMRILLFIVPLFVPSCADTTYDKVNFQNFSERPTEFEQEILKSLQTVKNFFAEKDVVDLTMLGLLVSNGIPELGTMAGTAFVLRYFLAVESDWKKTFSHTLTTEIERSTATHDIEWMVATLKTIETKPTVMSAENPDMENRKTAATFTHSAIDEMLNLFEPSNSLFKKYPLIGAPLLIELASFIAFFHPLAISLIPFEARHLDLSCKMRNILLDYRPRTVNARLEKLHVHTEQPNWHSELSENYSWILFQSMLVKYNPNGYNTTTPGTLNCEKENPRARKNRDEIIHLHDDFGVDDYYFCPGPCIDDYALLVRHRVENVFPVELFSKLCQKTPQKTGFGWLTIKLKKLRALRKWDDTACELFELPKFLEFGRVEMECDPFVRLFINDVLKFETPVVEGDCCHDVDETYTSERISKSALIKIEVLDKDEKRDELILRTEGNVEQFLRKGYRAVKLKKSSNYIDTISFWQDEYNDEDEEDEEID